MKNLYLSEKDMILQIECMAIFPRKNYTSLLAFNILRKQKCSCIYGNLPYQHLCSSVTIS